MEDTNNFEYVNVKARVPKVIDIVIPGAQGLPGEQGTRGPKGEPFRYEDFTQEQLEALKGPKGDKGEDGRDGTSATADNAHRLLLQGNVWCESASVDDVLTALIGNMGKPFPRTEFKPLTVISVVIRGQRVIGINGEPHYTVKVVGNDTDVFGLNEAGIGNITIEPLGDDDVKLTYHNFTGDKVGEHTITGIVDEAATPADDTFEENGVKFALYGRKIVINATGYTGNDNSDSYVYEPKFNFFGKWDKKDIDTIEIYANKPRIIFLNTQNADLKSNDLKGKTILVRNPKNITFKTGNGWQNNQIFVIGTVEYGARQVDFKDLNTIIWNAETNRYENTGYQVDHL